MRYERRVVEAMSLMYELHADQLRKGTGEAFIAHPMAVAALTAQYGGNEDQFIAALLHDAVEDRGGRPVLARIQASFGPSVAGLVWECSDTDQSPKPPWRERKEAHLLRVLNAPPEAKVILAADKIHNIRSMICGLRIKGKSIWDAFKGGRDGSLWYYDQMRQRLSHNWPHPILDEFNDALSLLHATESQFT